MSRGPLALVGVMAEVFDAVGIPYALGGSLASSLFGEPRSTIDVDIAVRLDEQRCDDLVDRLGAAFHVPIDGVRRPRSLTPDEVDRARELYLPGQPPGAGRVGLGRSAETVRRALVGAGVPMRRPWSRPNR